MKRKISIIIMISLLFMGLIYQSVRLNDARREAVESYKTSLYHLQIVNDIMLDYINTENFDNGLLQGYANRCVDLLIIANDIDIPADNYYNRLTKGLRELSSTDINDDKEILVREMTFLLESLKELYVMIGYEIYMDTNEAYKKIYVSMESRKKSSEYLASQERSFYK